jgi:hypothetical protein
MLFGPWTRNPGLLSLKRVDCAVTLASTSVSDKESRISVTLLLFNIPQFLDVRGTKTGAETLRRKGHVPVLLTAQQSGWKDCLSKQ